MNFTLRGRREPRKKKLVNEEWDVTRAAHEDEDCDPSPKMVSACRKAADLLAAELGGPCSVEVLGHQTTGDAPDDFRPAHLSVTVSRLHPEAA